MRLLELPEEGASSSAFGGLFLVKAKKRRPAAKLTKNAATNRVLVIARQVAKDRPRGG
jgi:hypothetical protein